jgi:hypothetical protein
MRDNNLILADNLGNLGLVKRGLRANDRIAIEAGVSLGILTIVLSLLTCYRFRSCFIVFFDNLPSLLEIKFFYKRRKYSGPVSCMISSTSISSNSRIPPVRNFPIPYDERYNSDNRDIEMSSSIATSSNHPSLTNFEVVNTFTNTITTFNASPVNENRRKQKRKEFLISLGMLIVTTISAVSTIVVPLILKYVS